MLDIALIIVAVLFSIGAFFVWFIDGYTRPRNFREDPNRDSGEFDGHIDVKKWNKREGD